MKLLVTGAAGQIGRALLRAPPPAGLSVSGLGRDALDIVDPVQVATVLDAADWDVVVNAAAYTAVDRAETDGAAAFAANRDGPAHLAAACARRGVCLIHLSTDYVFDGSKPAPYTEADPSAPLNVYGASKAAGETEIARHLECHVILRTSWVYGVDGVNFVKTVRRLSRERSELAIVADQIGAPTAAADIAATIFAIAPHLARGGEGHYGTFHYTGGGFTSWHGFAARILDLQAPRTGPRPRLRAISAAEYPTPARRPANSRLDCTLIGQAYGIKPIAWEESLERVLAQWPDNI